jgi:hypothetical protein
MIRVEPNVFVIIILLYYTLKTNRERIINNILTWLRAALTFLRAVVCQPLQ